MMHSTRSTRLSTWHTRLLWVSVAAALSIGCSPNATAPAPAPKPPAVRASQEDSVAPKSKTVKLVIEFGDGAERVYDALPWVEGDTVLAAMDKAETAAEPTTYSHSGSGDAAFVNEINGVKNEGTGSGKKNWLFWVNGKLADQSAGAYLLKPADEVVWKFAEWPVE
jgi:hypothetical protein